MTDLLIFVTTQEVLPLGTQGFYKETQGFIVCNRLHSSILLENFVSLVFFIVSLVVKPPE